ncbi:hypothetical protein CH273_14335 [Rhodococcus sp. 05-339-2]|nr:hypothetical protein CH273_14335 [Rhodococcus sp. 05-339-2]
MGSSDFQDTANFHWYGGGIKDKTTLSDLSALVGDRDVERWSASRNGGMFDTGSTSKSQSGSKQPIMTVDGLAAIPKPVALVKILGNRPVLKVYWSGGPNTAITASAERCGTPRRHRSCSTNASPTPTRSPTSTRSRSCDRIRQVRPGRGRSELFAAVVSADQQRHDVAVREREQLVVGIERGGGRGCQ